MTSRGFMAVSRVLHTWSMHQLAPPDVLRAAQACAQLQTMEDPFARTI